MSLKADADTRGRTSWRCAPLPVDLLSTLHACCPNIKAIHLWFLPTAGSDRTQLPDGRLRYAKPDLAAFSGLEELTLDSMFGDLPWWWSQVVRVLANSPRLRGLHLSIGHGALFSCAGDGRRDQFEGFLDRLCDEYSVEAAAPLRLRSLHLGHAVVPSRPGALARLTDLACLEDVYVSNCAVLGDGSDEFEIYGARGNQGRTTRVDWPVFGPRSCPRLARFSVVRYSGEVHALLAAAAAQDASFVRRLAVSCLEMDRAHGGPGALLRPDPRYPSLPVHVRMLEIDLYQGGDKDVGAEAVLRSVVEGDDGALEGLVVRLGEQFEETPASGDGDEQPGRPPKRVFPAVEFELLIGAVAGLANLTQLAVDWTGMFWNGVDGEGLPASACRLAAAAPRLRYVKVRDMHWRVGRGRAGETNGAIGLEMLRMRTPEFNQVELFRGSIWAQKIYHREYRP